MSRMSSKDFQEFDSVPKGRYHLKWVTDVEEEFPSYDDPDVMEWKNRTTFEVMSGKHKGKTFTDILSQGATPKTKLGQLVMAVTNADLPKDINRRDTKEFWGGEFMANVDLNANGYNKVVYNTINPLEYDDEDEEEAPPPPRRRARPANPDPLPAGLSRALPADDMEIPEGFAVVGGSM